MSPDGAALVGARVLVTGASRGYGAAIARALADARAHLVLTAQADAHLGRVMEDCRGAGATCEAVVLDLGSPASVDAAAQRTATLVPRLEGVVLNAGVLGPMGALADSDADAVRAALEVDLVNQVRLLQRIAPLLSDNAGVVLVTSGAAGRAGYGAYAIAKAGLEAVGLMLREEWAPRGIRVVSVNPGPVRTAMRAEAHPGEDPATVPPARERIAPVLAVLAGDDPGARVQAAEWGLS
jgi:NAD(P)-dependent dehydrogenase (short-subunit alcohol dehydrogenase family)